MSISELEPVADGEPDTVPIDEKGKVIIILLSYQYYECLFHYKIPVKVKLSFNTKLLAI